MSLEEEVNTLKTEIQKALDHNGLDFDLDSAIDYDSLKIKKAILTNIHHDDLFRRYSLELAKKKLESLLDEQFIKLIKKFEKKEEVACGMAYILSYWEADAKEELINFYNGEEFGKIATRFSHNQEILTKIMGKLSENFHNKAQTTLLSHTFNSEHFYNLIEDNQYVSSVVNIDGRKIKLLSLEWDLEGRILKNIHILIKQMNVQNKDNLIQIIIDQKESFMNPFSSTEPIIYEEGIQLKELFYEFKDRKSRDQYVKHEIKNFLKAISNASTNSHTKEKIPEINMDGTKIKINQSILNQIREIQNKLKDQEELSPDFFFREVFGFCDRKREKQNIDEFYHFFLELKGIYDETREFNKVRVVYQSSNPLENFLINEVTTGSCTEGPNGLYKEAALLGEICPNIGKLYLQSYLDDAFQENIGVAYILKCKDNDAKNEEDKTVWMIEGVETGVAVSLIKNQDQWKHAFYKGIYEAARKAGIKRIIFNLNVNNRRAKEFVRWLAFNESINKYVDGECVKSISKKKFEKKPPRYSLTLLDSRDGVITSLKDFDSKYYAEAWCGPNQLHEEIFQCFMEYEKTGHCHQEQHRPIIEQISDYMKGEKVGEQRMHYLELAYYYLHKDHRETLVHLSLERLCGIQKINKFNCCDSVYLDKLVKGIEIRVT